MEREPIGWFMSSGYVTGHLTVRYVGRMVADDILRFHSEIQSTLDEITGMGWRYLYIETGGQAIAEADLKDCPYELDTHDFHNKIEVEMGPKPLEIVAVPVVEEFRINISTKSFPRAVTVDLSKQLVTYVHDAFWRGEEEWQNDSRRIAEAKEVCAVLRWLLETKKLTLKDSYEMSRYESLSELLSVPNRE